MGGGAFVGRMFSAHASVVHAAPAIPSIIVAQTRDIFMPSHRYSLAAINQDAMSTVRTTLGARSTAAIVAIRDVRVMVRVTSAPAVRAI